MQSLKSRNQFKGSTKAITQELTNTFNDIYAEVMNICSVASTYYKNDSVRKQQFTFSKVLSSQGSSKNVSASEPAAVV